MKSICAWCQDRSAPQEEASHGICRSCEAKMYAEELMKGSDDRKELQNRIGDLLPEVGELLKVMRK